MRKWQKYKKQKHVTIVHIHHFSIAAPLDPCHKTNAALVCCQQDNVGMSWNPCAVRLKPKSRNISFAYSINLNRRILWKFCTEHVSSIAMLCPKFRKDISTHEGTLDKRDFARFPSQVYISTISLNSWLEVHDQVWRLPVPGYDGTSLSTTGSTSGHASNHENILPRLGLVFSLKCWKVWSALIRT